MHVRRQLARLRVGHPAALHDRHAHYTHRQCGNDGEDAARIVALQPIACMAIKAEARALQHHAQRHANGQGKYQGAPAITLLQGLGQWPQRQQQKHGGNRLPPGRQRRSSAQAQSRFVHGMEKHGEKRTRAGRVASTRRAHAEIRKFSPAAAYLAAQIVPAGLLIGTPTLLPYSVQEPS